MLEIKVTENYVGIEVKGDYNDLDKLYDCIFEIVGNIKARTIPKQCTMKI